MMAEGGAGSDDRRRTNFVAERTRHPERLALAFLLLGLAGLGLAGWSVADAGRLSREAAAAEARAAQVRSALAASPAERAGTPTTEEIVALAERIAFFNRLAGERHLDLSTLLGRIEAALPSDVWCRALTYNVETGILSLSLLGRDEASLPGALEALEAIDGLSGVILERQVRARQGREVLVQYDVQARAS